ncbi:MAG: hypothetical protein P1U87_09905 [Verrucomicrobiales bacterium]|nr:hypothetical protein [Verrucomicrobiales bacterium]
MKSNPSKQLLACLALLSLALFGANRSFAENEPTDDSLGGATPINLGTNGSQVIETGRISNSDDDYYSFSSGSYTSIVVKVAFQGSGPDTIRLSVYNAAQSSIFSQLTETGLIDVRYTQTFTISNPAGAMFFVGVEGNSADGNKSYSLTITPSPNLDLLNDIAAKESEISNKESEIAEIKESIETNKANLIRFKKIIKDLKKLRRVNKAKFIKKTKKAKARLRIIRKRKSESMLELQSAEFDLLTLEGQLADLEAQLP